MWTLIKYVYINTYWVNPILHALSTQGSVRNDFTNNIYCPFRLLNLDILYPNLPGQVWIRFVEDSRLCNGSCMSGRNFMDYNCQFVLWPHAHVFGALCDRGIQAIWTIPNTVNQRALSSTHHFNWHPWGGGGGFSSISNGAELVILGIVVWIPTVIFGCAALHSPIMYNLHLY